MTLPGGPLTQADLDALARGGISAELAEAARLRRVDSMTGSGLIGRNGGGDYNGIAIPYVWPGAEVAREYRLRVDHPPLETRDGQTKAAYKYLSPPARGNLLYLFPLTQASWLKDPNIPITVIEGEKKCISLWPLAWHGLSDSAEHPHFLPIAIPGVWAWRGVNGKATSADGARVSTKGPIADLSKIDWRQRKVTILFDTNIRSNPQVQAARRALTQELRKRGAIIHWFDWPANAPQETNGIDDLIGAWGIEKVSEALEAYTQLAPTNPFDQQACPREFTAQSDHYRLAVPSLAITIEADRLRWDKHELNGELSVRCELPGARTFDKGVLSIAGFNLSSARARSERAKLLAERAQTRELDWLGLIEEFCQRVLAAERTGQPAVDLRTVARPDRESDDLRVHGFVLSRRHPTILFGDGGTAKSYLALFIAGSLAERGHRVALFDWELAGEDHRDRLERLFGKTMPQISYLRCERALVHEADRLRRIVREERIEFAVYDSIGFACDGPPEAAEVAGRYLRAAREIGIGSLHVAHVSKAEDADKKPFGSVFWHNGARSTWFCKKAEDADESALTIGLFNRKSNLTALSRPLSFRFTFDETTTHVQRVDIAEAPDLAGQLSVRQRMALILRRGAMSPEALAAELDAEVETVRRTARRCKNLFTVLDGGKLALFERTAS